MKIYKRLIQEQLKPLLFQGKALTVTGARQVGKTTLLRHWIGEGENVLWLNADLSNVRERLTTPTLQTLANVIGDKEIVVIDEVQRIRDAGLLLKIMVDNFKGVQFIATGSSALEISNTIFEPLTGRQFLFHLFPFAFSELYAGMSSFELEQILPFHLIYGSYPEVVNKKHLAEAILNNLAEQYLYKDVLVWKDIRKPELLDKLLKLLAYQMGSEVSLHELAKQLGVNSETVDSYIDILEKSFVIYRLKSYSTNKRKEVSKMSKILFWDNGIRNAIIGDFRPPANRNDNGQLFENLIIGERMKMNAWLRPNVKSFFWRNYNQSEVDYVELRGQSLSGYEIKWSKKKKHKVTKAFTAMYPEATTAVINPENLIDFVMEKN